MGFFKLLVKGALAHGADALMNVANTATGGLAGKVSNTIISGAKNNAGLIGKVAGGIGKHVLSKSTRNKLSNIADKAIKYIPNGEVRTALTKINNVAQGRNENYKVKSKIKNMKSNDGANNPDTNKVIRIKPKLASTD